MNAQRFIQLVAAVAVLAGLAACAKDSGDNQAVRTTGARGADVGTSSLIGAPKTTCSNGQSAVGEVYDQSGNFRNDVAGLLSSSMDPQYLGDISGTFNNTAGTGVDLYMHVNLNGSISGSNSWIRLAIYDSYVNGTYDDGSAIGPIEVSVPAMSGWVHGSTFQVVFQDLGPTAANPQGQIYGTITVNGTISGGQATGTITYANRLNFISGNAPVSGNLGSFSILTCGLQ